MKYNWVTRESSVNRERTCLETSWGRVVSGTCFSHEAGGFLPFGCRKIELLESDAKKRVLRRAMKELSLEIKMLQDVYDEI